jgi:hypothetical protein
MEIVKWFLCLPHIVSNANPCFTLMFLYSELNTTLFRQTRDVSRTAHIYLLKGKLRRVIRRIHCETYMV